MLSEAVRLPLLAYSIHLLQTDCLLVVMHGVKRHHCMCLETLVSGLTLQTSHTWHHCNPSLTPALMTVFSMRNVQTAVAQLAG